MVALGGVICHLLLIPPWVFCTVLPCVATAMLLQRAQLAVLVAQVVLSTLAYQKPKTGVPVALVSSAISYAMYLGGDTVGFAGSFIYSAMQWINWGVTFPYVPAFTRLIFGLDMSSYYKKCELRGALDRMGRSRTLPPQHLSLSPALARSLLSRSPSPLLSLLTPRTRTRAGRRRRGAS